MKIIPWLMFAVSNIYGSQQMVMVLSDELNATTAVLQRYEKKQIWEKKGDSIPVVLGRNGLGWVDKEPRKMEGDGRSPAGVFEIEALFGYDQKSDSTMPYLHADDELICIDDVSHPRYNQIVNNKLDLVPKSFENMKRDDDVYRKGAVIGYNLRGEYHRGSCIFLHANHADKRPTAGCTAMESESLNEVLGWLDGTKSPILLQTPKSECVSFQKEFEGIDCR